MTLFKCDGENKKFQSKKLCRFNFHIDLNNVGKSYAWLYIKYMYNMELFFNINLYMCIGFRICFHRFYMVNKPSVIFSYKMLYIQRDYNLLNVRQMLKKYLILFEKNP